MMAFRTRAHGPAAPSTPRDVPRARRLALRHGWNAMAYQIVNDGMLHWFSGAGDAVVGYVQAHGVCIVAGAPICDGSRLVDVIAEWETFVRSLDCRTCYFGAAGRVFDALHDRPGYSTVLLGAQPVWHPAQWADLLARTRSLRAQMSRAGNKGVRVSEWTSDRASGDARLRACLASWLSTRRLPTLHFLVEPHTLHDLQGRRIFVAERHGAVIGFLNASPIPARRGWLIEQFVRSDHAPNGTIERLVDAMMRAVATDAAEYVTMGLVPLREDATDRGTTNPAWLSTVLSLTRLHGRRFYDFRGLEQFKTKFRPERWEPIYAITAEPVFSPRTLYAIAAAFTVQSPVLAVGRGLLRAIGAELATLCRLLLRQVG